VQRSDLLRLDTIFGAPKLHQTKLTHRSSVAPEIYLKLLNLLVLIGTETTLNYTTPEPIFRARNRLGKAPKSGDLRPVPRIEKGSSSNSCWPGFLMKKVTCVLIPLLLLGLSPSLWASVDPLQLMISGRADQAVQQLLARVQVDPKDGNAYNLLSRVFFAEEDGDRAAEAGEKAVALNGGSSEFHDWLGRAYGLKADHSGTRAAYSLAKKVRAEFERAVALDKSNIQAAKDLVEYYLDAPGFLGGGKDKAAQVADQLVAIDLPVAHWIRARVAQKNKDFGAAENEYKAEIAASKQKAEAWLDLATFYQQQKQTDKMDDAVQHALRENVAGTSTLFDAANLYYRAGVNLPHALELLHRYLDSNMAEDAPGFQAHYLLGEIDQKQSDVKAAANEFRAALAEASQYTDARDALNKLTASQVASRQ